MNSQTAFSWYQQLIKPQWAPPSFLFAPVWSVLYILITISFGFVFYQALLKKTTSRSTIPFLLNLLFNLLFTPIQFGLQNNPLAFLDIILVLLTLIWSIHTIYRKFPWVAIINIPYLLWVSFATVLQATITLLNL